MSFGVLTYGYMDNYFICITRRCYYLLANQLCSKKSFHPFWKKSQQKFHNDWIFNFIANGFYRVAGLFFEALNVKFIL